MVSKAYLSAIRSVLERTRAQAPQRLSFSQLSAAPFQPQHARAFAGDAEWKQQVIEAARFAAEGIARGELDPVMVASQAVVDLEQAAKDLESLQGRLTAAEQTLSAAQKELDQRPTETAFLTLSQEVDSLRGQLETKRLELQSLTASAAELRELLARAETTQQAQTTLREKVELAGSPIDSYSGPNFTLMTDRGTNPKRQFNEDSCGYAELADGREVYVVTDGMGGQGWGDAASRIAMHEYIAALAAGQSAVEALNTANRRIVEQALEEFRGRLIQIVLNGPTPHQLVSRVVRLGREQKLSLLDIIENHPEIARNQAIDPAELKLFVTALIQAAERLQILGKGGLGTTLVAAILDRNRKMLQLVQVGDSRAKIITKTKALGLTLDHSAKFVLYSASERELSLPLSDADLTAVENSPLGHANMITSSMGSGNLKLKDEEDDPIDRPQVQSPQYANIMEIPLLHSSETTTLLLYSDGLVNGLPESQLTGIARSCGRTAALAEAAMSEALKTSSDNVTVAAVSLPFSLDLDQRVETRRKADTPDTWERLVNGQVVEEMIIHRDGSKTINAVQEKTPAAGPKPAGPSYADIIALPLSRQLVSLTDASLDQAIFDRLLQEHFVAFCNKNGYQQIRSFLADPSLIIQEAAQMVMRAWVIDRLQALAETAVDPQYLNKMGSFLFRHHPDELQHVIKSGSGGDEARATARSIWQGNLQPVEPQQPQTAGLSVEQIRANPIEVQLRALVREPLSDQVRQELRALLAQNDLAAINKLRTKGPDEEVRNSATTFIANWLVETLTIAKQDMSNFELVFTRVRELGIQDVVLAIAQSSQASQWLRDLAGNLYDRTRRRGTPKRR